MARIGLAFKQKDQQQQQQQQQQKDFEDFLLGLNICVMIGYTHSVLSAPLKKMLENYLAYMAEITVPSTKTRTLFSLSKSTVMCPVEQLISLRFTACLYSCCCC